MAESNATQVILTDDGLKIIKAQSTADNAAGGVTNLNDPNLMSVIEKQNNIGQFAGLTSQYNAIIQDAKDDGIDTNPLVTAYNNLNRFMADILADPKHASDIDRVIYKKYQDAYNQELVKIQNALQNKVNDKFTSAANATKQAASTASQAFSTADSAYSKAQEISNKVDSDLKAQTEDITKFSGKADSAVSTALSAEDDARDAVKQAKSTASEFGTVKQKADSAVSTALSAQNTASDAVKKASSAAADSKDAQQIAGAVSQSYKTLTDGSTMTIAELQSGLAVKLTKKDLDGYATETWAQNKIKTTADGINGTISSIKSTVDGQTTSIDDLKADSSSFKSQFTTVNDTIGKHTKDIGTLQATSKELSSNFDSLNTDNDTNKHDISQLKQTAEGFKTDISKKIEQKDLNGYATETWTNGQIKLTADGFSESLSKKIEQKDLNGYATQDWAQNKINATADGINGTMSSIKSTVDGQTTSINDLKADSNGFRDQFTKVNNTINQHTTDIGTLQADAKSLSANFDSLNTDNNTNKHDISQLQLDSKSFSSTLVSVQQQVQNSAVGTNLLLSTGDLSANWGFNGTVDTSQKPAVLHYPMNSLTSGNYVIAQQSLNDGLLQPSTTYTASFYAKGTGTFIFYYYPAVTNGLGDNRTNIKLTGDYKRYTITFTTVSNLSGNKNLLLRQDYSPSATDQNTVEAYIYGLKLEKGSLATDWCLNPAENATQSQISQLSSDINLRVTKDDLIDQINLKAGNTLISSSGQLTLSGKNIYFDSNNPVIIPSANIDSALVNKKLTAADISANTFTTNNGTFTVEKNGAITAKNMTLIGGTLSTPTINAGVISGSTINGTTFHGGDIINDANNTSKLYPTTISSDGHIYTTRFSSSDAMQTDLSTGSLITKYRATNSSGNKYEAYDTKIDADQITLFAGHTNGKDMSFSQSVTGDNQDGYVLVSPLNGMTLHGDNQQITFNGTSNDPTPKGIIITPYGNINPNGTQNIWYVGNGPTMKTASFGIDGSGANNIQFNRSLDIGNFNINTYHTFTSSDNGPIYFHGGNGKNVSIYAGTVHYDSLVKSSLLSVKKDIKKADTAYWSQLINSIDLATYQYKTDDNTSHLRLSSIVDDVNVTKQWQLPDVFISRDENGRLNGVDDSVLLNATLATVQEQQKEIDQLNGHNMELEARLNKLEAKF